MFYEFSVWAVEDPRKNVLIAGIANFLNFLEADNKINGYSPLSMYARQQIGWRVKKN